jgi:glucose/arabinose dehydrogenase
VFGLLGSVAVGVLVAARDIISPCLSHPDTEMGSSVVSQDIDPNFTIELLGELTISPIRVAVDPDSGRVFVSGNIGIAAQQGAVIELTVALNGASVKENIVAAMLNRPHGLAVHNGEIHVSRPGQFTSWRKSEARHHTIGAVTVIKDLDGDGKMDYYDDIVSNLPGARGPDYLHQNNAIAFGADGALYISSGARSDGHPPRHEWEGTILRATGPNFSKVEVFARGLRNTVGLAVDANGLLFAADNDAQTGETANLGDKLAVVTQGDDFGHPYAVPAQAGVSLPLLISKFSIGGINFAHHTTLPAPYKNNLFAAVYGEGKAVRYEINGEGRNMTAKVHPFASVPGATDIGIGPNGEMYVLSYVNRTVHRIRPKG